MRMWKVDPKLMCRKHLLGEHVEMHMFVGVIRKRGLGAIKGYIDRGLVEISHIFTRHYYLAEEMMRRGYKHKSQCGEYDCNPYFNGYVDEKRNITELARRCKECRELQSVNARNDQEGVGADLINQITVQEHKT